MRCLGGFICLVAREGKFNVAQAKRAVICFTGKLLQTLRSTARNKLLMPPMKALFSS